MLEDGQVLGPKKNLWLELDLCVPFCPSRCMWCTGLSHARGVGPRWSRCSWWTRCAAWSPACWWTTENVSLSLQTSKKPSVPAGASVSVRMFVLSFALIPSGDGLRSESPSGSALLAETLALAAAVLRWFLLAKLTFFSSPRVREVKQEFLQLPFWVKKCHLAGIKPLTLKVDLLLDKAKLM